MYVFSLQRLSFLIVQRVGHIWCFIHYFIIKSYASIWIYLIILKTDLHIEEEKKKESCAVTKYIPEILVLLPTHKVSSLASQPVKPDIEHNTAKNTWWSKYTIILRKLHNMEKWEMSFEQLYRHYCIAWIWNMVYFFFCDSNLFRSKE